MENTTNTATTKVKPVHWILALISFVFIVCSLIYVIRNRDPERTDWVKGIAQVDFRFYGRTGGRRYKYFVNGKEYKGFAGKGLEGNCVGDIYEVLINPNDFSESYLLNYRPLFLERESIAETVGEITNDINSMPEDGFNVVRPEFSYFVNGKKYKRVQEIKVPTDSSLFLQKGMQFRVRYLLENPQRSILDYNHPSNGLNTK